MSGAAYMHGRLAPAKGSGTADPTSGVRQIENGTGGQSLCMPTTTPSLGEVQKHDMHGIVRQDLTLGHHSCQFTLVSVQAFTDNRTTSCH